MWLISVAVLLHLEPLDDEAISGIGKKPEPSRCIGVSVSGGFVDARPQSLALIVRLVQRVLIRSARVHQTRMTEDGGLEHAPSA